MKKKWSKPEIRVVDSPKMVAIINESLNKTRIIGGKRDCRKTEAIIREAARTGQYIVCVDRMHVEVINRQAIIMECDIKYPIHIREFMDGVGHGVGDVLIDDADRVLEYLLSRKVSMMSVSSDVEPVMISGPEEVTPLMHFVCPICGSRDRVIKEGNNPVRFEYGNFELWLKHGEPILKCSSTDCTFRSTEDGEKVAKLREKDLNLA